MAEGEGREIVGIGHPKCRFSAILDERSSVILATGAPECSVSGLDLGGNYAS
ncbi:hypothetical protein D3C85_826400 [compost metagenome]